MTTAAGNLRLIDEFAAAFNAHDAARYAALCTEDAVWEQEGMPPLSGQEAIAALRSGQFQAFPDVSCRVLDAVADADRCFVWFETRGTHNGTLNLGDRGIPPTGRFLNGKTLQRVTVRDGKAAHIYEVVNFLDVFQQLGLTP